MGAWMATWRGHLTGVLGGCVAILLGILDAHGWLSIPPWGSNTDLSLIWGGLGALGVTGTAAVTAAVVSSNGSSIPPTQRPDAAQSPPAAPAGRSPAGQDLAPGTQLGAP